MEGRFGEVIDTFALAERILRERCVAVAWELDIGRAFTLWSLFYCGELGELVERVPGMVADARERGDRFGMNMFASGWANLAWLCVGDVEGARRVVDTAMNGWAFTGFHLQHYLELLARAGIDLYVGDGEAAWRRVEERWPALEASWQLHVQHNRVEMLHLRARAALAGAHAAAARGDEAARDRRLARVAADARALEREDLSWPRGLGWVARGGVHDARGERAAAIRCFERALTHFEQHELPLHAAVSRRRLGQVVGGDQGAALIALADADLSSRRVSDPARFCAIWAPGTVLTSSPS
jgi:hypothetical protein